MEIAKAATPSSTFCADLMITLYCSAVSPINFPEKEQSIVFPLFDVEFASGITVSPLVVSRKKWENRPFKTPFYINVVNEGIEL